MAVSPHGSSAPPSWAGVLEAMLDGTSALVLSWRKGRKQPAVAGVPDEKRNLTATAAFFIGSGLAEQLAARFNVPTTSLRVSVRSCRAPDLTCTVRWQHTAPKNTFGVPGNAGCLSALRRGDWQTLPMLSKVLGNVC